MLVNTLGENHVATAYLYSTLGRIMSGKKIEWRIIRQGVLLDKERCAGKRALLPEFWQADQDALRENLLQ